MADARFWDVDVDVGEYEDMPDEPGKVKVSVPGARRLLRLATL